MAEIAKLANVISSQMAFSRLTISGQLRCHCRCGVRYLHNTSRTLGNEDTAEEPINEEQPAVNVNVSRLPERLRNRMKHVNIAPDPTVATSLGHLKPKYRRKLYAKYGAASGVNPGLMWPSKEELQEKIADEEEWDPSLQAMLEDIAAKKEAQQALYKAKEEAVEKGMANMPKYIKEYKARLLKAEEEKEQAAAKQKELMEEARDYFGYYIERSDPRFVMMQEQKELEAKAASKAKKKEQRDANVKKMLTELLRKKGQSRAGPKKEKDAVEDEEGTS